MRFLLLLIVSLVLGPSASTATESECPTVFGSPHLPTHKVTGRLIIYESDGMRCSIYINETGMAGGAGAPSCIPWPDATGGFRIIRVVETRKDN